MWGLYRDEIRFVWRRWGIRQMSYLAADKRPIGYTLDESEPKKPRSDRRVAILKLDELYEFRVRDR